ncbi:TyeA family type III secretion system gatekeeper subunit [Pseudomonas gelidaquae]|uniref:TyeA family type III secretion system gatekeeper subunit n=1 Tax=Pseudomonas sp. IB20 TaxID=1702250 RepID=UPI00273ECFC0|nr:TyeA family type III secretion system gatekeeper subunit [Pseudomonas sp. IB20]
MKVESLQDAPSTQRLDQPAAAPVSPPTSAKVDELAPFFDQEVIASNRASRLMPIHVRLTIRQVVLLNALYPMIRELPLALWPDSRVRQGALDSFLAVMGELDRVERGPLKFAGDLGTLA